MKPTELMSNSPSAADSVANPRAALDRAADQRAWVDLAAFRNDDYSPGRGPLMRGLVRRQPCRL